MIDEAMLRPGRLETPLFVNLPGSNERADILSTLLRGKNVEHPDPILDIARTSCYGYSGADLGALLRQAGLNAISRKSVVMNEQDFRAARVKIAPSVGNMEKYHRLREKFGNR